jgi:hypothetical protein
MDVVVAVSMGEPSWYMNDSLTVSSERNEEKPFGFDEYDIAESGHTFKERRQNTKPSIIAQSDSSITFDEANSIDSEPPEMDFNGIQHADPPCRTVLRKLIAIDSSHTSNLYPNLDVKKFESSSTVRDDSFNSSHVLCPTQSSLSQPLLSILSAPNGSISSRSLWTSLFLTKTEVKSLNPEGKIRRSQHAAKAQNSGQLKKYIRASSSNDLLAPEIRDQVPSLPCRSSTATKVIKRPQLKKIHKSESSVEIKQAKLRKVRAQKSERRFVSEIISTAGTQTSSFLVGETSSSTKSKDLTSRPRRSNKSGQYSKPEILAVPDNPIRARRPSKLAVTSMKQRSLSTRQSMVCATAASRHQPDSHSRHARMVQVTNLGVRSNATFDRNETHHPTSKKSKSHLSYSPKKHDEIVLKGCSSYAADESICKPPDIQAHGKAPHKICAGLPNAPLEQHAGEQNLCETRVVCREPGKSKAERAFVRTHDQHRSKTPSRCDGRSSRPLLRKKYQSEKGLLEALSVAALSLDHRPTMRNKCQSEHDLKFKKSVNRRAQTPK